MTEKVIQQQGKERKNKGIADIVFAIDVTASMTPCIDELKNNLKVFVENLKTQTTDTQQPLDWRARILPFRDLVADKNEAFKALDNSYDFVTSEEDFKNQINGLIAQGGGDIPESIFDALYIAAKKTEWREKGICNRFIVLFSDAYPLEELHESTVEPDEDRSVNNVMKVLMQERIKLYVVAPEHKLFKELEMLPKSQFDYVKDTEPANGLKNVEFGKLLEGIGKTVSALSEPVKA